MLSEKTDTNVSSQLQIQDFPWGGRVSDLPHMHFTVKIYAKTKQLGPVGGWLVLSHWRHHLPPPDGSTNGI